MALTIPTKPRYHEDAKPAKQYDYDRPESKRGVMARNPNTDPRIPQIAEMQAQMNSEARAKAFPGMSDQEIRARALECAARLRADIFGPGHERHVLDLAEQLANYIRNGRDKP